MTPVVDLRRDGPVTTLRLGQLRDDAEAVAAAEHEVIATIVGGLRA